MNYGGYETQEEVSRRGIVTVWTACAEGQEQPRFVVKVLEPRTEISGATIMNADVGFFLDAVKVQEKLTAANATHWAPIRKKGSSPLGTFYVTERYRTSVQDLAQNQYRWSHRDLLNLVQSVLAGLDELRATCQRSYANLKPGNILLQDQRVAQTAIVLTDPLPDQGLSDKTTEAVDLRALAELVYTLVTFQPFKQAWNWPIPDSPKWHALGLYGKFWRRLCNDLLDPQAPPERLTTQGVRTELAHLNRTKKLVTLASVAGAVVLVGLIVLIAGFSVGKRLFYQDRLPGFLAPIGYVMFGPPYEAYWGLCRADSLWLEDLARDVAKNPDSWRSVKVGPQDLPTYLASAPGPRALFEGRDAKALEVIREIGARNDYGAAAGDLKPLIRQVITSRDAARTGRVAQRVAPVRTALTEWTVMTAAERVVLVEAFPSPEWPQAAALVGALPLRLFPSGEADTTAALPPLDTVTAPLPLAQAQQRLLNAARQAQEAATRLRELRDTEKVLLASDSALLRTYGAFLHEQLSAVDRSLEAPPTGAAAASSPQLALARLGRLEEGLTKLAAGLGQLATPARPLREFVVGEWARPEAAYPRSLFVAREREALGLAPDAAPTAAAFAAWLTKAKAALAPEALRDQVAAAKAEVEKLAAQWANLGKDWPTLFKEPLTSPQAAKAVTSREAAEKGEAAGRPGAALQQWQEVARWYREMLAAARTRAAVAVAPGKSALEAAEKPYRAELAAYLKFDPDVVIPVGAEAEKQKAAALAAEEAGSLVAAKESYTRAARAFGDARTELENRKKTQDMVGKRRQLLEAKLKAWKESALPKLPQAQAANARVAEAERQLQKEALPEAEDAIAAGFAAVAEPTGKLVEQLMKVDVPDALYQQLRTQEKELEDLDHEWHRGRCAQALERLAKLCQDSGQLAAVAYLRNTVEGFAKQVQALAPGELPKACDSALTRAQRELDGGRLGGAVDNYRQAEEALRQWLVALGTKLGDDVAALQREDDRLAKAITDAPDAAAKTRLQQLREFRQKYFYGSAPFQSATQAARQLVELGTPALPAVEDLVGSLRTAVVSAAHPETVLAGKADYAAAFKRGREGAAAVTLLRDGLEASRTALEAKLTFEKAAADLGQKDSALGRELAAKAEEGLAKLDFAAAQRSWQGATEAVSGLGAAMDEYQQALAKSDQAWLGTHGGEAWAQVQTRVAKAKALMGEQQMGKATTEWQQATGLLRRLGVLTGKARDLETVRAELAPLKPQLVEAEDQARWQAADAALTAAAKALDPRLALTAAPDLGPVDRQLQAARQATKALQDAPVLVIVPQVKGEPVTNARIYVNGGAQPQPDTLRVTKGKAYDLLVEWEGKNNGVPYFFYFVGRHEVAADGLQKLPVALTMQAVPGHPLTTPVAGLELRPVSKGTFRMGSERGDPDEKPVHAVVFSRNFWMGKYEITQAQYLAIAGGVVTTPFKGDRFPAGNVSWDKAVEFCRQLTEKERAAGAIPETCEFRLPTEAEWEYVCRAGTTTEFFFGDDPAQAGDYAWTQENSQGNAHEVGTRKPNAWGFFDFHGNVVEWCQDFARADLSKGYLTSGIFQENALDPLCTSGDKRVCRGGSFDAMVRQSRAANRNASGASFCLDTNGFRVVLVPK